MEYEEKRESEINELEEELKEIIIEKDKIEKENEE